MGDSQRITQILLNLLSNAFKFTRHGVVSLTVRRQGERLLFIVEDSGIGMSPEVLQRLFNPYMQAQRNTVTHYGGTGLGLYISKQLAERMDGDIEVSSKERHGSRFTLSLPWVIADQPPQTGK